MNIPKPMRYVVSAISRKTDEIGVKRHYLLMRNFEKAIHPPLLPPGYKWWDYKVTCCGREVPVRVFLPEGENRRPHSLIVFFHGGGGVTGGIATYTAVCAPTAQTTGCTVISADYCLAPEHRFPAALLDCCAVIREAFLHASGLGIAPDCITLAGDSAGGNLAAAVSLWLRDHGERVPARMILFYPLVSALHDPATSPFESIRTNGQDNMLTVRQIQDYIDLYKSCDADLKSPYFVPMEAPDLSGQPETLILTAELDPLRDEGEAYGERLRSFGGRADVLRLRDCFHGFLSLPGFLPPVRESYRAVNRFLERAEPMVHAGSAKSAARPAPESV